MKAKQIIKITLATMLLLITIQVSAQSNKVFTGYRYHSSESRVSFRYTKEYFVQDGGYITLYKLYFAAPDKDIKDLKENKRLAVIHYPNKKQIIGVDDVFDKIKDYSEDYIETIAIAQKEFSSSLVTTIKYTKPTREKMTERGTLVMTERVPNRLQVKFKDKSFTYVDMSMIVIEDQGIAIDPEFDFYELDKFNSE